MQTVPEVVNAAALVERCKLILSLGDKAFIRGQVVGDNDRPERMAVGLCLLLDYGYEVVDHFVKELGLKYGADMRLAKSGYLTGERRAVLKAIIEAYEE